MQFKRGIVIACPNKYENICLNNIISLREKLLCQLPIEIWEIGNEISPQTKNKMNHYNVFFKNVYHYTSKPNHWKGFQVKVFALFHSEFEEVILCDADVTFFKNPEIIFNDDNYLKTGAYFFKDLEDWKFYDLTDKNPRNKFNSLEFFNLRKNFIKSLIPTINEKFPKEWAYIYDETIPNKPVKEALQESGVVLLNKTIHKDSLNFIYKLNDNYMNTYQYVWGDKETFWIGCVMANKDYYFNETAGFMHNQCLTHKYKNELFWKQK